MLTEPFGWLRDYFFKTNTFMNTYQAKDRAQRFKFLLRLILPMFLISYPLAVLLSFLFTLSLLGWINILIASVGTLSGFLIGISWEQITGRPVGILASLWLGGWLGMWASISWLTWLGILFATIGAIALGTGLVEEFGKITTQSVKENRNYLEDLSVETNTVDSFKDWLESLYQIVGVSIFYFIRGSGPSVKREYEEYWAREPYGRQGNWRERATTRLYYFVRGTLPIPEQNKIRNIGISFILCVTLGIIVFLVIAIMILSLNVKDENASPWWAIWWAMTMGPLTGILARVTLSLVRNRLVDWAIGVGSGITLGVMLGPITHLTLSISQTSVIPAVVEGLAWGIGWYMGAKSIGRSRKTLSLPFFLGIASGIVAAYLANGWIVLVFLLCYCISYYQLPLWVMSYLAVTRTKAPDRDNPSDVFAYLHASSLYWDRWEVLPLPGLEKMMQLAIKQDIEQAIEIMDFIKEERPLQFEPALNGLQSGFFYLSGLQRNISRPTSHEKKFPEFFAYLRTLLRWNAWEVLSLSDLTAMMRSAIEQDMEKTREIMTFIETERPLQLEAARAGLRTGFLTLVAHEMETCKTLLDISGAIQQFTKLQSLVGELHLSSQPDESAVSKEVREDNPPVDVEQEEFWEPSLEESLTEESPLDNPYPDPPLSRRSRRVYNVNLEELLTLLIDVSLDAAHYRNSLSWQNREDALQRMIANLEKIKKNITYRHRQLFDMANRWISTAQHELDKLQQEPQRTYQINNPYIVGPALQRGTSLFVGRQDLVQQLEQGLSRGSHRPTFFLNGERRMGKSSTLRQLPDRLDKRHFLPIFFDLQAPEMTSSTAAFLSSVAEKMSETMEAGGLQVEPLEKKNLQDAMQENEARVYSVFDEWLKSTERTLDRQGRIVLLSFDEFENLEMVGKMNYLDLHLLLNWFRSTIQNRPQLALLFSGGKSVSEMGNETGINWSGYFVNVQTFRVGFLRKAEARQLITQPVPDYPIEQIFGDGVVDEIIRVTGCHPFLVQAVCSNLVNNLNADSRHHAELPDVEIAVKQVLDDWEDGYFQDLWTRTDAEQRACLIALNDLKKGDIQQIAQQIHRDKEITRATFQAVRHTLQMLFKRDLVLLENEIYRIATPIFSQWVERNS